MVKSFWKGWQKFNQTLERAEVALSALFMIALLLVALVQVVCRYVLYISTPWAEETARSLFIAAAWIAAAAVTNQNDHIVINAIDTLIKRRRDPDKIFWILNKISFAVALFVSGYMVRYYWDFWLNTMALNRIGQGLKIPLWIPQMSPLIAAALFFLHSLNRLAAPRKEESEL